MPDTLFKDARNSSAHSARQPARPASNFRRPSRGRSCRLSSSATRRPRSVATKEVNPEPDAELRDTESRSPIATTPPTRTVPASVRTFFDREVRPHVPDAWIDTGKRDPRDGRVGVIGSEINFNRYFYRYKPPRPLEEIEADIRAIEGDIVRMLAEVTGASAGS
jgi:type I restriction enzyme M protein